MHWQSRVCFIGEDHPTLIRMGAGTNRYSVQHPRSFFD
jgi:hypothetical protein